MSAPEENYYVRAQLFEIRGFFLEAAVTSSYIPDSGFLHGNELVFGIGNIIKINNRSFLSGYAMR